MFGYIMINKPELKVKDYDTYQAYYCGLCHVLKQKYGKPGQLTLSYDMTFLSLLLTGLYEPETRHETHRCFNHVANRHPMDLNCYTEYAADMNILLAFYDLMDDWVDDHNYRSKATAELLRKYMRGLAEQYPRQYHAVRRYVKRLSVCEKKKIPDLDLPAGLTGQMLGEIFVCEEDMWAPALRRIGFYLGKYIYLMDAWEDRSADEEKGAYNPWLSLKDCQDPEGYSRQVLTMMMSECSIAFEQLPILTHAEILRNILYSGVWCKYEHNKENPKDV